MSVALVPVSGEKTVFPGARSLSVRTVRHVLNREFHDRRSERVLVGINFIRDKAMTRLNRLWKKRTGPTDVLSFNFNEPRPEGFFLGEIYISADTLVRQAGKAGHSTADELVLLLIHGTLHLLGHEHNEGERKKAAMIRKEAFFRSRLMKNPKK